jgi:cysteinyl-tRNA synthetase, unknown class
LRNIAKKVIAILVCAIIMNSVLLAFAEDTTLSLQMQNTISLYINNNNALVNGEKTSIDVNQFVRPYIKNNRTLIPVRFLTESLKASINWHSEDAMVEITYNSKSICMYLDKNLITVNGNSIVSDVYPEISQGRTFIPVRLVCEFFDKNVFWDNGLIIVYEKDMKADFLNDKGYLNKIISEITKENIPSTSKIKLENIKYWAYQINGNYSDDEVKKLVDSKYDLIVLEPTRTISKSYNYDIASVVKKLKESKASDGISNKLVLAYIDIGQVEDWRWYYDKIKNKTGNDNLILGADSEGWSGSYQVKYWSQDWKDIMINGSKYAEGLNYNSNLQQSINDGFDGVYLDWVEAYENGSVLQAASADGVSAKLEMLKLLSELRTYTKAKKSDFYVIQQNGANLIEYSDNILNYVDGIAQEAVWYDGEGYDWDTSVSDIREDSFTTSEYLRQLTKYKNAGKVVLNVEYAENCAKEVYELSRTNGFIPYCTRRGLDKLTNTAPY